MPYAGLPEDADLDSTPLYAGLPADAIPPSGPSRTDQIAKGASMNPQEASDYMRNRAAFAREGNVSTFGTAPPKDTRKISYTPTGYKPNAPAKTLKEFAKNTVQDLVELPTMPVRAVGSILNAPDTLGEVFHTAKSAITTPLGFVPYVSELATGKTAGENWLTNPGLGALTVAGGATLGKAAKGGVASLAEFAKTPNVGKLNAAMETEFTKAVRPSVARTRTASQAAAYAEDASNAAKEIVLHRDKMDLTDTNGNLHTGLPENLQQFREAIPIAKREIWAKVEAINKAAGETGAQVPLTSAVEELNNLGNNAAYRTMSPETISYAAKRAKDLSKEGALTVDAAQDAITLANQSQANFLSNPSPNTASRAYVDSLVANHLRKNLDAALEQATGTPAAAPLRKAYGSLKAIERDVNQRATVDARKNTRGLIDFTDIYTAGELVNAIATLSPAGAAKAGTMAAAKAYIKHLNNPNTHVKRLFKTADKLVNKVDFPLPESSAPIDLTSFVGPGRNIRPGTVNNTGMRGGSTLPARDTMGSAVGVPNNTRAVNTGMPVEKVASPNFRPGSVNTGIAPEVPPSPNFRPGTINTGVPIEPVANPNVRLGSVGAGIRDTPAAKQVDASLGLVRKSSVPDASSWKGFVAQNMGQYMKEEGSHGAAMQRLSREWKESKPDTLGIRGDK